MLQIWFPFNGNLINYGHDISQDLSESITAPIYVDGVQQGSYGLATDGYNTGRWPFESMIGATQWTIAYWLYMDSTVATVASNADIFNFTMTTNGQAAQTFRDEISSTTKGRHRLYIVKDTTVGSNTNATLGFTGNRDTSKDKWTHITIRKTNEYLDYFEDGVQIKHVDCTTFESVPSVIASGIQFGHGSNSTGARLQDWRFYDNVLTDQQILNLSKRLTAPPCQFISNQKCGCLYIMELQHMDLKL